MRFQTLFAADRTARGSRSPQKTSVTLTVESLEDRLVLSSSSLGLPTPVLPQTFGPPSIVASPEGCRCVHGYKWRPPPSYPRDIQPGGAEVAIAADSAGKPTAKTYRLDRSVVSLIFGGSDGNTVKISPAGHIGVSPPEGPLPMER